MSNIGLNNKFLFKNYFLCGCENEWKLFQGLGNYSEGVVLLIFTHQNPHLFGARFLGVWATVPSALAVVAMFVGPLQSKTWELSGPVAHPAATSRIIQTFLHQHLDQNDRPQERSFSKVGQNEWIVPPHSNIHHICTSQLIWKSFLFS